MLIGLRWTHKTRIVEQNAFNGKYVEGVHCFGMFELWLSILKVVAEGLTAAFGILGLLTSFRNEVTKNFGWLKTIALLRKVRHRGTLKVDWIFTFACAAYNLVRMRNLMRSAIPA